MAKFIVIKQIDFGNSTILDKNGCASCFVPVNDYAPKVGSIIEGTVETKPISDGNGHTTIKTGITWPIRTNGAASTQGQTSIKFIPIDYLRPASSTPVTPPVTPPTNPPVIPPTNPVIPADGTPCYYPLGLTSGQGTYVNGVCVPNLVQNQPATTGVNSTSTAPTTSDSWSVANILSGLALIFGVVLVIWGAAKVNTDQEKRGILYIIIGALLLVIHFIFPVKVILKSSKPTPPAGQCYLPDGTLGYYSCPDIIGKQYCQKNKPLTPCPQS